MQPIVYSTDDHQIDSQLIDPDALFVMRRLREEGFKAYLVGGSVRDLLLKQIPKDFDISTSALPEEIKKIFNRNCILIGRRFRLAHVRFGHKIIEVSTFRSGDNEEGLIVHDNEWGSPEEDVLRRDFTINGLFYDPATHTVIDYVEGWKDIHKKVLRTIGHPHTRFRQDPVRMIRLLKFTARFGFDIDAQVQKALSDCCEEIVKSSPARILEEVLRMLESGASANFFRLMSQSGLLEHLFPCLTHFLATPKGESIYQYLECADQINRNSGRNTLERSILATCLLFPLLEQEIQAQYINKEITPHMGEIMLITSSIIKAFITSSFSHFPRRITATMSFILSIQYRLTPLSGKKHPRSKLFKNKEFILALKFLKIRALVDESLMNTYIYWKEQLRQHERHGERKPHHPPRHKNHADH